MPDKIKESLQKAKEINKENNDNKLSLFIYDCINVENNIKDINYINENIIKYNNNNIKLFFIPYDNDENINTFLESIKNFGKVINNDFYNLSSIINNDLNKQ